MEVQEKLDHGFQVFIEKLEVMAYDIRDELSLNRQLRAEWASWHSMWKRAWLVSDQEILGIEEKLLLREKTSVKKRKKV